MIRGHASIRSPSPQTLLLLVRVSTNPKRMLRWTQGPDLSRRATEPEIIDNPAHISEQEMEQVLIELALVNRWLGGSSACLRSISQLLSQESRRRPIIVADIGTGSGDILCALAARTQRQGNRVQMLAMDINPVACRMARKQARIWPEIGVVRADVENLPLVKKGVDFILCSTLLHHFGDRKLVELLTNLRESNTTAIIINDLHRHPVAYWAIRFLTRLFSRSRAVRNDGPLSVRKGFTRRELLELLESAGCRDFCIRWRWAFRWVVIIRG